LCTVKDIYTKRVVDVLSLLFHDFLISAAVNKAILCFKMDFLII